MSAKEKLLDKAAEHCSPATYKALAARLGISRSLISNWKAGDWPMPQERIAEIARIAQVDAGEWMLLIEAEQAKGEAKKAYGSLVKRLGIAALLGVLATPAWAGNGYAVSGLSVAELALLASPIMHYAKSRYRLARRSAWRFYAALRTSVQLCEVPSPRIAA